VYDAETILFQLFNLRDSLFGVLDREWMLDQYFHISTYSLEEFQKTHKKSSYFYQLCFWQWLFHLVNPSQNHHRYFGMHVKCCGCLIICLIVTLLF